MDTGKRRVPQLPESVIVAILQHVPLPQRLSCCALVCSSWASAAASATQHVQVHISDFTLPLLHSWLVQHCEQLVTVDVGMPKPWQTKTWPLRLPWPRLKQLQHLKLDHFQLQLQPQDISCGSLEQPHVPHAASFAPSEQLVSLELQRCTFQSPDSLLQLSKLTRLRSLQLADLIFSGQHQQEQQQHQLSPVQQVQHLSPVLLSVLPQLSQLTSLTVQFKFGQEVHVDNSSLAALSGMQLQQLSLAAYSLTVGALAWLPSSLTALDFTAACTTPLAWLDATSGKKLCKLNGLRDLTLSDVPLHPGILAHLPQLEHLKLQDCMLATAPVGTLEEAHGLEREGGAALLAVLPHLTRLQHLELVDTHLHVGEQQTAQYSALTACSQQLYALTLVNGTFHPLDHGALQYMFPPGRQLPHLELLQFVYASGLAGDILMDGADLQRISTCCPNLQHLSLVHAFPEETDLTGLLQMAPSLTSLCIGGPSFDDAAAEVVVQLTKLRSLSWEESPGFTDIGLERLTALQQLDELTVMQCDDISLEVARAADPTVSQPGDACIELAYTGRGLAPVWQQLQDLCDFSPAFAPKRLQEQKQHLQTQKQRNMWLHQQLAEARSNNRLLEQQLTAVSAELASAKQLLQKLGHVRHVRV